MIASQSQEGYTGVTTRESSVRLLCVAAWFALAAGLAEVVIYSVRRLLWHQVIQQLSLYVVWLTPLANVCLFTTVGLLLLLLTRVWPRLGSIRVATFLFAFLACMSLLLLFVPPLHKYVALCLAAGLATQTSRLITIHAQGFYTLVRRTLGWAVGLIVGLAVNVYGWQVVAERRGLAQLPPAHPKAPNVLLIVLDTVRAKSLSLYGNRHPTTPALELFAKTGVLFERAYATAPWTLPSHASMFTGRFPHELSADWLIPLDATYPTLAEVLSAHGYRTAGFVANTSYCSYETGLPRGFVHYEDYRISPGEIVVSSSLGRLLGNHSKVRQLVGYYELLSRKNVTTINRDFLHWLSRQDGQPFFAFLNYFDAHIPYVPPPPFDEKFGPKTRAGTFFVGPAGRGAGLTEKHNTSQPYIQMVHGAYEGTIAYIDAHLGRLFAELQQRNLLENTLVIITADHGEQFGEHGLFDHGNSLYMPLLHVPLLIAFPPRIPAGLTIHEPVTLRDLPSTIVSLLPLESGTRFPGHSLARYWDNALRLDASVAMPVLSEVRKGIRTQAGYPISKGDMQSLVMGSSHYIRNGDGREELYDLEHDPLEEHDLAHTAEESQRLEHFRTSLATALTRP